MLSERYLDIRGHTLRLIVGGTGKGLVLLLASPLIHAGLYRRTAIEFAAKTAVVVVDLPGCGKASRVNRPLQMEELAEFVPDLIASLGAASAILVGHSNSGAIAIHAAVRCPNRLAALVLADSIGAHPSQSLFPLVVGRTWDAILEPRLTLTGWPAVVRNLTRHTSNFFNQVRMSAGEELLDVAAEIRVPTLLAWGGRDHTLPLAVAKRFQAVIPHARIAISDTGSHDWIIEQPTRFASIVMAEIGNELFSKRS